jgi:putative peptide zinc metalloprotease protein
METIANSPDFAVLEIETARPRLRPDLRWTFQEVRGEGSYLLEDPLSGRFYRLGRREHEFARSLDGRRSVAALVAAAAKGDPRHALDAEEAASLVRMLVDAGLVAAEGSDHAGRVFDEVNRPQESKRVLGKMGQVLFLKVPLGNPDRFFAWLAAKAGWLASPWFALVWLGTLAWGGLAIHGEKERFLAQMSGLFDFGNLWILGALWLVLKVFHECWHGFVCRRFGGAVPEAGVTLLLLTTPLGYVNASSSAAFPSRWHRIAVSGAGMYGELLVAALAAILWARVEPGPLSAALHQVVVLSSITTLLFNANPLMRFDGYYLLSDLLDVPNLYGKGQSVVHWWLRRWALGMRKAKFPLRSGEPRLVIALYGAAAWVWKGLVVAGLLVAAAFLFEGAGLLLALVAGTAMLLQAVAGSAKYLKKSAASEGLRPARLVLRLVALSGLLAAALFGIEVAPVAKAPAVVRDAGGGEVRARCPGFLAELAVRGGERVAAGDLLLRLENAEERARLARIEAAIARSRLLRDHLLQQGAVAASQAEAEHLDGLEKTAAELREHVASLELRAPRDGTVDGRHLELLLGTWIEPGRVLLSVIEGTRRELVVLAAADERDRFEEAREAGRPVEFRPRGRWGAWPALLGETVPRAGLDPVHFALVAPGGGPLAVRQRARSGGEELRPRGDAQEELARYELTQPRFEIRAALEDAGGELREGEIGIVSATASESRSLADLAWNGAKKQISRFLDEAASH